MRRHPPAFAPVGAEAAVKDDKNQRYGTKLFGKLEIFKFDFEQSVRAEYHTQQDKCQQHRYTETCGNFVEQYAEHRNKCNTDDSQLQA